MMKALEAVTEAVAHRQVEDMKNSSITHPDKFHRLGLRTKTAYVGKKLVHLPILNENFDKGV